MLIEICLPLQILATVFLMISISRSLHAVNGTAKLVISLLNILDKEDINKEKSNGQRKYTAVGGSQVQEDVVSKGHEYWKEALDWGKNRKLLDDIEVSFLFAATKMNVGRIPSEKQCQRIVNIEAKLLDEGFSGKR